MGRAIVAAKISAAVMFGVTLLGTTARVALYLLTGGLLLIVAHMITVNFDNKTRWNAYAPLFLSKELQQKLKVRNSGDQNNSQDKGDLQPDGAAPGAAATPQQTNINLATGGSGIPTISTGGGLAAFLRPQKQPASQTSQPLIVENCLAKAAFSAITKIRIISQNSDEAFCTLCYGITSFVPDDLNHFTNIISLEIENITISSMDLSKCKHIEKFNFSKVSIKGDVTFGPEATAIAFDRVSIAAGGKVAMSSC